MAKLTNTGHGDYNLYLEAYEMRTVAFVAGTYEKPTEEILAEVITEHLRTWSRFIQDSLKKMSTEDPVRLGLLLGDGT